MELAVGTLTSSSKNSVKSFLLDCPLDQTSPKNNQVNRIHNLDSAMSRIPLQVKFFQNPTYTTIFRMQIKEKFKYILGQKLKQGFEVYKSILNSRNMNNQQVPYSLHGRKFSSGEPMKETRFSQVKSARLCQKDFQPKDVEAKRQQGAKLPSKSEFFAAMKQVQS